MRDSGVRNGLLFYWRHGLAGCGYTGAVGRVGFTFIKAFVTLAVVAKKIAETLGRIDVFIIVVAECDDGGVLVDHANEHRTVAMPPAIVIDKFFAVGDHQHAPAETIVALTGFLEAITRIGAVEHALREELTGSQRL